MELKKAKELCHEHEMLLGVVGLIEEAADKNYWIKIKTPRGESYLSDIQIRVVLEEGRKRISQIEKTIEGV